MRSNEKKITVAITPIQKELLDTFTNQHPADVLNIAKCLTSFSFSRFQTGHEILQEEVVGLAYLKDFIGLLNEVVAAEVSATMRMAA
jgi:hypothetical protein